MVKHVLALALCSLLTAGSVAAQEISEAAAWELAKESGTSADVYTFIQKYPDGEFAKEAKSYMIDLLWVELATNAPETTSEETPAPSTTPITFSAPLTEGSSYLIGKTLEQLIAGTPLYPPVAGLPEEYWKTQECSSCHQWEQDNLCTQANTYLSDAGAENLVKQHPYGGTFKLNLRNWAQSGCE